MQLSDKNLREKEFHNKLQSRKKGRFENIFYKAIYNSNEDFFNFLKLNSTTSSILKPVVSSRSESFKSISHS